MSFPYCPNPKHTPKNQVFAEMQKVSELCFAAFGERQAVLHADIIGGEPLLHPDILEIAKELYKYRTQFVELRIVTNSTIVPKNDLCEFIKSVNDSGVRFIFLLDHYPKVSTKYSEIIDKLDSYGIPYRVDNYVGDDIHFNGWVDIGNYEGKKEYKDAKELFCSRCVYKTFICLPIWNGKIYPCAYTFGGEIRGTFTAEPEECIDLFDESIPIENRIKWIKLSWIDANEPLSGCYSCNGVGWEGQKRFAAAEQS